MISLLLRKDRRNELLFYSIVILNLMLIPGCSTKLHKAASAGDITAVRRLLINHANLNERDANGNTPLLVAAKRGHSDVVELLITEGANINIADNNNNTLLHIAAETGNIAMVEKLISLADATKQVVLLEKRDVNNLTAIDLAKQKKQFRVVKYLETYKLYRSVLSNNSLAVQKLLTELLSIGV